MENTFIIGPSMKKWLRLKSLLVSYNINELATANELVESFNLSEKAKNIIVDHLNANYPQLAFLYRALPNKKGRGCGKNSNKNILVKFLLPQ